jgi:hypothetical protein
MPFEADDLTVSNNFSGLERYSWCVGGLDIAVKKRCAFVSAHNWQSDSYAHWCLHAFAKDL